MFITGKIANFTFCVSITIVMFLSFFQLKSFVTQFLLLLGVANADQSIQRHCQDRVDYVLFSQFLQFAKPICKKTRHLLRICSYYLFDQSRAFCKENCLNRAWRRSVSMCALKMRCFVVSCWINSRCNSNLNCLNPILIWMRLLYYSTGNIWCVHGYCSTTTTTLPLISRSVHKRIKQ